MKTTASAQIGNSREGISLRIEGCSAAVFIINGIGDAILSLPTIRALAELFKGRLSIAFAPKQAGFILEHIHARKVPIEARTGPGHPPEFRPAAVARDIGSVDFFFSLVNWQSMELEELLRRVSPAVSCGKGPMFQLQLPWLPGSHVADSMFDCVKLIVPTLAIENFWGFLGAPQRNRHLAAAVSKSFPPRTNTLAVHMDTAKKKCWESKRFASTVASFLNNHPNAIGLLLGKDSSVIDASLFRNSRVVRCLGLSVATSVCLLGQADLFVGVDSCFLHAADMMRIPGVGLFGPTSANRWGFRVGPGVNIQGDGSLDTVEPECVLAALESLALGYPR